MPTRSKPILPGLVVSIVLAIGLILPVVAAAAGPDPEASAAMDERYTTAASDASGVVRTDLGIAQPATAPGEELGLWHYSIPVGQELAPHTHPGWQLARVTAGERAYSLLPAEGTLLRADGSHAPMGPGTYVLATADGVIENPDLVHFGANRGDEAVAIISASLFAAGEPVASLVTPGEQPTPEPAASPGS
jgi:hypothetical protein